jgi:hypothetical protein
MQSVMDKQHLYSRAEQQAVVGRVLEINEQLKDKEITISRYVALCAEKLHLRTCLREFSKA